MCRIRAESHTLALLIAWICFVVVEGSSSTTEIVRFSLTLSPSPEICRSSQSTTALVAELYTNQDKSSTLHILREHYVLKLFYALARDTDECIVSMPIETDDVVSDVSVGAFPFDDAALKVELDEEGETTTTIRFVNSSDGPGAIKRGICNASSNESISLRNFSQLFFAHATLNDAILRGDGEWIREESDDGESGASALLRFRNMTADPNNFWRKRSVVTWKLRIDRPGMFEIRLCPSRGNGLCAGVRERFVVVDCVAAYEAATRGSVTRVEREPTPTSSSALVSNGDASGTDFNRTTFFSLHRPIPFDGTRGIKLPASLVNPAGDTWTLSFAIFLPSSLASPRPPANTFRGLFYKGPNEVQRTPSAWLLPNSTRIIFKVSLEDDPDVGGESRSAIPFDRWTHIAFEFRPRSASLYVDGALDVRYDLPSPMLRNDGPLYVGKDPWLPGFRGLLGRIEMREGRWVAEERDVVEIKSSLPRRMTISGERRVAKNEKEIDEVDVAREGDPIEDTIVAAAVAVTKEGERDDGDDPLSEVAATYLSRNSDEDDDTDLAKLLLAAVRGSTAAHLGVASRYRLEDANDCDAYLAGYRIAAEEAVDLFHRTGEEPIVEIHRLASPESPAVAGRGERGLDDEEIQFQLDQAESGHVPSMVAMASLFYYGARGVPRDQARAFGLFSRAAGLGNTEAETAMGNLLIKGEGCERNATEAVEWYRLAARKNHSGALNGLGYAYWNGDGGLEQNRTAALEHFESAAREGAGADAWFNAGYIHDVEGRVADAETWWRQAAAKFGHVDAVASLGKLYADDRKGDGKRDCRAAATYYRAAVDVGPWRGRTARDAYDAFLRGDVNESLRLYLRAAVTGCDAAAHNAAYVLDRKIGDLERAARLYGIVREDPGGDADLRLGELVADGVDSGGVRDWARAARLWTRSGNARAALRLAELRERGDGVAKNISEAKRLYALAIERNEGERKSVGDSGVLGVRVAASIGLLRLNVAQWFERLFWGR